MASLTVIKTRSGSNLSNVFDLDNFFVTSPTGLAKTNCSFEQQQYALKL